MQRSIVKANRLKIGFILARSFTLSAFALFTDTLRLASDELDRSGRVSADWQVLASTQHLITASCGIQVAPTSNLTDPAKFDCIVVVGGLLSVEEPIDRQTIAFLKEADAKNICLIGLCTGSFILADAGLMKNHETCVSWLHFQAFHERFPDHEVRSDRIFALDKSRGSCAGGTSSADLAASLVRQYIGKAAERNALEVLQIENVRFGHDVQPRRPLHLDCDDDRVKTALIMMEQKLDREISLDGLAASVGLSRRQLERLFHQKAGMSPGQAYIKIRMEWAKKLLMQTKSPMIDIALDVGFGDASHFARSFKRIYGQTPTQVRASVRGMQP
ncbi:GlxA family transcriptional regulator [Phyllobacterium sp. 22229]|uniref:AraC family transcriptional regulator n=1 Tax=Phyllobacterium myrsinacearum TaxID=28101 RepID=A0A2S9JGT8_9HYPH|nr:GlxA family transcriptional regulator [Phyllobacterium myrsinacearum]PRD52195.1 AraC family transcriptional regulator [Phyllobacterium myrsinacearum]PWV83755.1 AraC family transcriptional regulator with amidase-like domain [Phyllobacterium myrsinacearum]RZS74101.1 AraC family transcriptional regulator with amidase-like domain [Phyllobacterium myrsinacearum]RZV04722.1 AraC family transcriptional regulator with amidase-like domain [Phyllobacterium myrsinacearum]